MLKDMVFKLILLLIFRLTSVVVVVIITRRGIVHMRNYNSLVDIVDVRVLADLISIAKWTKTAARRVNVDG